MSLRDDLQEIHGIGEAKADEIMAVVDAHDAGESNDNVHEAYEHLKAGHDGIALKFLRRAVGEE